MSWLNANEYFFMEFAARERVEDLNATIEAFPARAEGDAAVAARREGERVRGRGRVDEGKAATVRTRVVPAPCRMSAVVDRA
jgi:hypothetical protein